MKLKILLYLIICITYVTANTNITISEVSKKTSILENSFYFIDTSSKLKFNKVKQKTFSSTNTDYLRLGYTDATLWIKFSIKNTSNKNIDKFITASNPMLDIVELYTKVNHHYNKEEQGISNLHKYDRHNILHSSFKINFKAYEEKHFYYKSYSISSANYLKLHIQNKHDLYKDEFTYQLIESLFFGAMFALLIYNLFIFIFTKQLSYLFYSLFLFFVILNHISYTIMIDYIVGEEYSQVEAYFASYYLAIVTIFALLFVNNILDIKKYKTLNLITNIFITISVLIAILSIWSTYILEYSVIFMYICMFYLVYLSIFSLLKKHAIAKYIVVAWSINILGIFSLGFTQFGIPNPIDYFPYFYEFTSFLEAILFSIALASKLNKTKELENSFKTNKVLIQELHHRIKNNMSLIMSTYRMKLEKTMSKEIGAKILEVENIIIGMSQIHDYLYNEKKLEEINTEDYFKELIRRLKQTINTDNIKLDMNIKISLSLEQSIYCGQIINELITNSIKYAFIDNLGKINISLIRKDNKTILNYKDNGIGFDYEDKKHDSFGLYFINTIIKEELKASVIFNCKKNTDITIVL